MYKSSLINNSSRECVILPKQSFFVKYSIRRHIHWYKEVWVGIQMDKANVTGRKML